jgi:hypothetical protein
MPENHAGGLNRYYCSGNAPPVESPTDPFSGAEMEMSADKKATQVPVALFYMESRMGGWMDKTKSHSASRYCREELATSYLSCSRGANGA